MRASPMMDKFGEPAFLPHAPPTSFGTYLDGVNEGWKSLKNIKRADIILFILGIRLVEVHIVNTMFFTSSAMVVSVQLWLCRDTAHQRYIALKIMDCAC